MFSGLGFFGSMGMLGARRAPSASAAARKAAAQAKQVARQEAAAQKQLSAAMSKAKQTVALQAKEAGLQAKLQALQAGQTTKQAAQAMRTAQQQAKAALKSAPGTTTTPGTTNTQPYVVTPPAITPNAVGGGGYVTTPPRGYPVVSPNTGNTPFPQAGGGGYAPPMSAGGYAPPAGAYTIGPSAGGYAIGGPQGYTPAYGQMTEVSPQYGVYGSGTGVISPVIGGTSIYPAPGAGGYSIGAPGLPVYPQSGDPLANIAAYTTAEPGDSAACTRKRTALSKAYQRALQRMQKNPNAKALATFEKQLPNKIKQLLKKCPAPAPFNQLVFGGPQRQCPPGSVLTAYGRCAIGQQPTNPFFGPQYRPQFPGGGAYPTGSGPQPGETVYQDGSYSAGSGYTVESGGSPYTAQQQGGQYGPPPSGAVIGPVSGRGGYSGSEGGYMNASGGAGYADVPVQSETSFDAVDPNVLAMADTGAMHSGLDETDNQDQSVLAMSELPVGDTGSSFSGFAGFSRVGRRKPKAVNPQKQALQDYHKMHREYASDLRKARKGLRQAYRGAMKALPQQVANQVDAKHQAGFYGAYATPSGPIPIF